MLLYLRACLLGNSINYLGIFSKLGRKQQMWHAQVVIIVVYVLLRHFNTLEEYPSVPFVATELVSL